MDTANRPLERLLLMFATNRRATRRNPGVVRKRNNGFTQFCELSGIAPAIVSRWRHGTANLSAGDVPPTYNDRVLLACDRAGIPRSDLVGILRPALCPTCGQDIKGTEPPLGCH